MKKDFPIGKRLEGIFINGYYESMPIRYGELAYAFAEKSQTMLNITNGKVIKLYLEDEEFELIKGELIEYKRVLDMKNGIVTRNLVWMSPKGKKIKLSISRIVSLSNKYLMAIEYKVTPLMKHKQLNQGRIWL